MEQKITRERETERERESQFQPFILWGDVLLGQLFATSDEASECECVRKKETNCFLLLLLKKRQRGGATLAPPPTMEKEKVQGAPSNI